LTIIVIAFEVAGLPETQDKAEVSWQVTTSPLAGVKVYDEFVALPIPVPLTFHWYVGEMPPFTGVAVNITELPAQNGFAEAVMETPAGNTGFTVIVTCAELMQPLISVPVTV